MQRLVLVLFSEYKQHASDHHESPIQGNCQLWFWDTSGCNLRGSSTWLAESRPPTEEKDPREEEVTQRSYHLSAPSRMAVCPLKSSSIFCYTLTASEFYTMLEEIGGWARPPLVEGSVGVWPIQRLIRRLILDAQQVGEVLDDDTCRVEVIGEKVVARPMSA